MLFWSIAYNQNKIETACNIYIIQLTVVKWLGENVFCSKNTFLDVLLITTDACQDSDLSQICQDLALFCWIVSVVLFVPVIVTEFSANSFAKCAFQQFVHLFSKSSHTCWQAEKEPS